MPYNILMEFIESSTFTRLLPAYLTDDEYLGLQMFLISNPESGKIIPGSGGIRKIKWRISGKGKRGGIRVIYYYKRTESEIWLLTIYNKSEKDSIPTQKLLEIAKEIENE